MKKKAIMVLALAAAMMMSACGANNGGTEGEATFANESSAVDNAGDNAEDNAGEKTTTEKETEKETEETTTEATTAAELDNELFAYYKPLGEAYEKYKDKMISNCATFNSSGGSINIYDVLPIAEYNDVLYFHTVMDDSNNIYSYNFDTKEYKKSLDLNSIEFPNGSSDDGYSVSFEDGYFYVNFYTDDRYCHYHKIDLEGNLVQSFLLDYHSLYTDVGSMVAWPYLNHDGSLIYAANGRNNASGTEKETESADATGDVYFRVSPDFKTTTKIKAPETEAAHGIMEKTNIVSLSADVDGNLYCVTNDDGVFFMEEGTDEWVYSGDFNSRIEMLFGKYWRDGGAIIDIENGGEVVAKSDLWSYSNARNYFCGDGNMVLNDGAWYKVQIPSDGSEIDFSQYEPMGKESRDDYNIIPVNDTYYLYHDDYGYFLHTYEKGEEEEETVMLALPKILCKSKSNKAKDGLQDKRD